MPPIPHLVKGTCRNLDLWGGRHPRNQAVSSVLTPGVPTGTPPAAAGRRVPIGFCLVFFWFAPTGLRNYGLPG